MFNRDLNGIDIRIANRTDDERAIDGVAETVGGCIEVCGGSTLMAN